MREIPWASFYVHVERIDNQDATMTIQDGGYLLVRCLGQQFSSKYQVDLFSWLGASFLCIILLCNSSPITFILSLQRSRNSCNLLEWDERGIIEIDTGEWCLIDGCAKLQRGFLL